MVQVDQGRAQAIPVNLACADLELAGHGPGFDRLPI